MASEGPVRRRGGRRGENPSELFVENALLRQQLIVAVRSARRPKLRTHERGILVALARLAPEWREAMLLVKPEAVLRWHREGLRIFWKSRPVPTRSRAPRIDGDTIALIRHMATTNRTWGAERIRGELLKLGIRLAKRTIQRHIRDVRPPHDGQRWRTFLRNHATWACDFLQVYDVWFRPLFAFFIVDLSAREVVHLAVTRSPSAAWTAQQLRNATQRGVGPQLLLRDNSKFSPEFDRVAAGAGVRVVTTAVRAPNMNAVCERFLGSVRRECLDQVIVLGEEHLRCVLREHTAYFNGSRPHQGLGQRVPRPNARRVSGADGRVVAIPVLGGLHHEYRRAA